MCVLFERHLIHPNTIIGTLQAIYAVVIDIISGFVFGFSKVAGAATRVLAKRRVSFRPMGQVNKKPLVPEGGWHEGFRGALRPPLFWRLLQLRISRQEKITSTYLTDVTYCVTLLCYPPCYSVARRSICKPFYSVGPIRFRRKT